MGSPTAKTTALTYGREILSFPFLGSGVYLENSYHTRPYEVLQYSSLTFETTSVFPDPLVSKATHLAHLYRDYHGAYTLCNVFKEYG